MKGITFVLFYYLKAIIAQVPCKENPIPDNIYFNETSVAGSIVFVSNETNSTKQDWIMSTNTRVELLFVNQTYQIILLTAVELDVTNPSDNCVSGLEQFAQPITCTITGGLEPVNRIVTFHVIPENEYPPDVDAVPGIYISEGNVTLPYYLAGLLNYFKDRDCPKDHLVLSISKYSSTERDVSQYFMVNSSTGYLYQIKRFDYEDTDIQCGLGKGGGFLNITAEDGPHTTSKSLGVTFVDVDDTPPVFVKSECSSTCYTCPVSTINADVPYSDQGTVVTDPPSIKALDPDTDPTNITYSMEVYPEKYRDNIQFDNGTFVLLQSFANFSGYAEESDFTVTVTMQATGSNGQMSDNLTLSINVKVPPTTTTTTTTTTTPSPTTQEVTSPTTAPPTTTTPAPVGDANSDMSDDNKVLVIVLAVIGGVVVLILIVVVYKVRTKQPQQKYNLKDTKGFNGTSANGGASEKEMTADNPVFDGEKGSV